MKQTKKRKKRRVIHRDSRFLENLEALKELVSNWEYVALALRVHRQTLWRWRSGQARPFHDDKERARLLVRVVSSERDLFESWDLDLEDLREAALSVE
jgi:hypothetical protein